MRRKHLLKGQKKAKALLFWEEEETHAEESDCCRQKEPTNHLYSICKWQEAWLQIIQRVKNTDTPINKCRHRQWVSGTPKDSRQNTKRSKKNPLTHEDKKNNRQLSRERVLNENVIGSLKRFKIIADRYRNRRKRFSLRFNLIAGIYNLELI